MFQEPPPTPFDLNWHMLRMPVRVNPYFWLAAVFSGIGLGDSALIGIWVFCLFASILVHELGHALTARALGASRIRVLLHGFGGLALYEAGISRGRRVAVLLMGPGAGFILFGLAFGYASATDVFSAPGYLPFAMRILIEINLFWGLANLLPVFPLDGGQIARELIRARRPHDGLALSLRYSFIAAVLAALGFLAWNLATGGKNYFPVLLFGLLAYLNYQLSRPEALQAQEELHERRDPWEQDPDWWKK